MRRNAMVLICVVFTMMLGMCLAACASPASSGASDAASSGAGSASSTASGEASDTTPSASNDASGAASDASNSSESASADSTGTSDGSGTSASDSSSSQPEKPMGVSMNLGADSILTFDGDAASAQLVDDMYNGKTPTSCTVLYDQMGALPSVTVTDDRTIREVYTRLARMQVSGGTNTSITDSYHMVSFELQDGTTASYSFEGEGILARGRDNYAVLDRGDLWSYVRHLQEQYLHEESAGDDWLPIQLDDEEEMVLQCPTSAPAGEVVTVYVYALLDADLHVSVNDDERFGTFISAQEYEFVMPNAPVTVRAWITSDDYQGS